jgi:hypothetical protein
MVSYKFVVFTNAKPGRDEDYNQWYEGQHFPDVLKVPGFVSAQRFGLADEQRSEDARAWKYLALYDIETDDIGGVLAELSRRLGTAQMPATDAMHEQRMPFIFVPLTPLVLSSTES